MRVRTWWLDEGKPQRHSFATRPRSAPLDLPHQSRLLRSLFAVSGVRDISCHSLVVGHARSGQAAARDLPVNRLAITSRKTKRHGKGQRIVPLFPELQSYLQEAFEAAPVGSEYVIHRHRGTNVNLRTQLLRNLDRAHVDPWERLFHNLRASRQTELELKFPSHVVCDWMGNSEAVARKHYLQTTDDHFAKAVTKGVPGGVPVGPKVDQKWTKSRTSRPPQALATNRKKHRKHRELWRIPRFSRCFR